MKKNKLIEVPTWSDFRKQEGLVAEKSENKTLNAFRNEASKDFLDARSIDYSKWLNLFFCIQTGKEFNKLDVIDIMGIAAERFAAYQFEQGRKEGIPKWINVNDELPKGGDDNSIYCLVQTKTYGIVVRPFNVYHNVWDDEDGDDTFTDAIGGEVTHWMLLPDKPHS